MNAEINKTVARRVLEVVDRGLTKGLGNPEPGHMCVEAAVCYALGLPHGDDPGCVTPALRRLKIGLNDSRWSSAEARAIGLRRLALVQLGSAGFLDDSEFMRRVAEMTIRTIIPNALRNAASIHPRAEHRGTLVAAAAQCEEAGGSDAAHRAADAAYAAHRASDTAHAPYAAYRAAYAAYAAHAAHRAAYATEAARRAAYAAEAADAAHRAGDAANSVLADFAEGVVQILVDMEAPGAKWLVLTEEGSQA